MHRRELLKAGVSALAAPMLNVGYCRLSARSARTFSTAAIDLVNDCLVIDMLGLLTRDWPRLERWHRDPSTFTAGDFEMVRSSGIRVFNPAVDLNRQNPYRETHKWLDGWNRLLTHRPDCFVEVKRCSDLLTAQHTGKIGLLLGIQNANHFRNTSDVSEFWQSGLRLSQLTYNGTNRLGHGCTSKRDEGLTPYGADVVRSMNTIGMVVDVSHCGPKTTLDTIDESTRPVLVTHSNCAALVPHPRCKSDEVIRALARKGGVMGVTSIRTFLRKPGTEAGNALDHITHIARVAGIEHAGMGSDIDLSEGPERVFELADAMLAQRWSESDIRLVLGGNFARAMGEIFSA